MQSLSPRNAFSNLLFLKPVFSKIRRLIDVLILTNFGTIFPRNRCHGFSVISRPPHATSHCSHDVMGVPPVEVKFICPCYCIDLLGMRELCTYGFNFPLPGRPTLGVMRSTNECRQTKRDHLTYSLAVHGSQAGLLNFSWCLACMC